MALNIASASEPRVLAIDVTGAPRYLWTSLELFWRVLGVIALSVVMLFPFTVAELGFGVRLDPSWMQRIAWGMLAVSIFLVFFMPPIAREQDARRVPLGDYGVSYADARRAVARLLHKPFFQRTAVMATLNLALALVIFVPVGVFEPVVRAAPHGDWAANMALVFALLFALNAVCIYERWRPVRFVLSILLQFVFPFVLFILYAGLFYRVWSVVFPQWAAASVVPATGLLALSYANPWTKPILDRRVINPFRAYATSIVLPSARDIARHDRRHPVLYLRSFHDDHGTVQDAARSNITRVEEVIARPLRELGPFIAIGRPGEFAQAGAAREYCSDDVWQSKVADLMARAGFIVAVAGWTTGLQWEVSTLKERGFIGKLIWVVPVSPHREVICNWLRASYRGTPYEQAANAADLSSALAVHTLQDGRLAVVSARSGTAGAYQAAIQSAVFGMTRHLS